MNLSALLVLVSVAVTSVVNAVTIGHDKVQPFPQPEPVTGAEKAAVKFKPQLLITSACMPYPAVNAAGETSGGLKGTGQSDGKCEGSPLGSQVYGRSGWHRELWAIMYAWYFPKDRSESWINNPSHRHDWANIVVWIDNPDVETPKVVGVSTSWVRNGKPYLKNTPPNPDNMAGTSPKVFYINNEVEGFMHALTMVSVPGGFQDLIMWEQLTEEARTALSTTDFGNRYDTVVPFIDGNFEANLDSAWPY